MSSILKRVSNFRIWIQQVKRTVWPESHPLTLGGSTARTRSAAGGGQQRLAWGRCGGVVQASRKQEPQKTKGQTF